MPSLALCEFPLKYVHSRQRSRLQSAIGGKKNSLHLNPAPCLVLTHPLIAGMFAPALRPASARAGVTSICMGRKGAQTGVGGGNTRTVTRDRKKKAASGVSVVKVRRPRCARRCIGSIVPLLLASLEESRV
eukprot:364592-Rhodomonas_salina.3